MKPSHSHFHSLRQWLRTRSLFRIGRRRRLQKLRFRVQWLRQQLALKEAECLYLEEQVAGYRDAFAAIQTQYNAIGAAAKAEIAVLTKNRMT